MKAVRLLVPQLAPAPATSALYDEVSALASQFSSGGTIQPPAHWTTVERDLFLSLIGNSAHGRMSQLDALFGLSSQQTPPFAWLAASIRANYSPGLAGVERVLMRGGSNSAVLQLYNIFAETPSGRDAGRAIFERAKFRYIDWVRIEVAQRVVAGNVPD